MPLVFDQDRVPQMAMQVSQVLFKKTGLSQDVKFCRKVRQLLSDHQNYRKLSHELKPLLNDDFSQYSSLTTDNDNNIIYE